MCLQIYTCIYIYRTEGILWEHDDGNIRFFWTNFMLFVNIYTCIYIYRTKRRTVRARRHEYSIFDFFLNILNTYTEQQNKRHVTKTRLKKYSLFFWNIYTYIGHKRYIRREHAGIKFWFVFFFFFKIYTRKYIYITKGIWQEHDDIPICVFPLFLSERIYMCIRVKNKRHTKKAWTSEYLNIWK